MVLRRRRKDGRRMLLDALSAVRQARVRIRMYTSRLGGLQAEEARRLRESLYYVDYILEAISLRLETILTVSGAVQGLDEDLLRLPYELSKTLSREAESLPPEIGALLDSIEQGIASLLPEGYATGIIGGEELSPQAETIIKEARERARREAEKAEA